MKPPRPFVAAFVVLYMLVFGVWAVTSGNSEFLFYAAVMAVLIGALWVMDRRVRFSGLVLWGLAVWGCLHMAGGTVPIPQSVTDPEGLPRLYSLRVWSWFIRYDQFVHAFGFGVATLAVWEGLVAAVRGQYGMGLEGQDGIDQDRPAPQPSGATVTGTGVTGAAVGGALQPTLGLALLLVCAGMGLGALNEVVEFTATRIMPKTNVGGYENTGWDLVSNLVGTVIAAGWVWRGNKGPKSK